MATILLVEDEIVLAQSLIRVLEEANHQTYWERQAESAREVLQQQSVELILLDIMLPGDIDGYQFLSELKASEKYRAIPVIMMSNFGQANERDQAMQLGAIDYLIKANFDLSKIVERINQTISPMQAF